MASNEGRPDRQGPSGCRTSAANVSAAGRPGRTARSPLRKTVVTRVSCDACAEGGTLMSKLRVNAFGISIDGYGAGPEQALDHPMGVGGMALHKWVFGTRTFQK